MWNNNDARLHRRSSAEKNPFFYDLKHCTMSWSDMVQKFVKTVNDPLYHISKRIRACALLAVAELLEEETVVPLKDAHSKYSEVYHGEIAHLKTSNTRLYSRISKTSLKYKTPAYVIKQGLEKEYLV